MNNQSSFIFNLKNILLSIFILLISENCFSQSGWIQQNSGTLLNLNSIQFVNSETGFCAGDNGTFLKTTNKGVNWNSIPTGSTINFKSMSFPSQNTGFIVGDSGLVLKTTNGGLSLTNLSFQSISLNSVSFLNDTTGYAGGIMPDPVPPPKIFRSVNGGFTWDSIDAPSLGVKTMFFLNEMTGWCSGSTFQGDALSKTTNGSSWVILFQRSYPDIIKSIFFVDSLNGWMGSPWASVGSMPTILKTTNGGQTWYDPYRWTNNISYSLFFTDLNNGWSAGDRGLIYHTTNSGLTWITQTPAIQNRIYRSIYFIDSLTGWCVGDSGRILKTTTGGVLTGFSNASSEIPDKYFLSQNYPNPFNPSSNLGFGISKLGFVSLKVYDVLGNEVSILVNETKPAGNYNYQFSTVNYQLSSGIYFYRLEVNGNHIDTKRMILLK